LVLIAISLAVSGAAFLLSGRTRAWQARGGR